MSHKPFVPQTAIEQQFQFICSIPHPSGGERALGQAIMERARAAGLDAAMDGLGNVLVKKQASPGWEGAPTAILQAHMDMVCAKEPGIDHDFAADPLKLYVDEAGWLGALGTSLGADDGYGMAYMLDILLGEGGPEHPPLECLFTVEEEIGLLGAAGFDVSQLRGKYLISLDSEGEMDTVVSTAGGQRLTARLQLRGGQVAGRRVRIAVGGLSGGHSAGVIHEGRANAIKLLSMLLVEASKLPGASLIHMEGGEAPNAIPRGAQAHICVAGDADLSAVRALGSRFAQLYRHTDPNLGVTLEPLGDYAGAGYDFAGAEMLALWPSGVYALDPTRPGVVEASDNLGVVDITEGVMTCRTMLRSIGPDWLSLLEGQMALLAAQFGATCEVDSVYPGMKYQPDSKLRAMYADLVLADTGKAPRERATHGGMEVGYFATRIPGVDIVSISCDARGCHSPSEMLDLRSFNRVYGRLRRLLANLKNAS